MHDNAGDKNTPASSPVKTKGKGKEKIVKGDAATSTVNTKGKGKGKGKEKEKVVEGGAATSPAGTKGKSSRSLYKPGFVLGGATNLISRPSTEAQGGRRYRRKYGSL